MVEADEITFEVINREPGYNNVSISGTYTGPATEQHVKDRFYHSYFGGREAWCKDGKWGCVVHID
jgi:hypothetical protein